MGLPELPVVDWLDSGFGDELEDEYLGLCWKTRYLVAWAEGRAFACVDDEITDADREWVAEHHPGLALLHFVEPSLGLLGEDYDVLDRWLRSAA
jgi:hypothetical protein